MCMEILRHSIQARELTCLLVTALQVLEEGVPERGWAEGCSALVKGIAIVFGSVGINAERGAALGKLLETTQVHIVIESVRSGDELFCFGRGLTLVLALALASAFATRGCLALLLQLKLFD